MAEKDRRYYWLKLKRDFFKRHDIRIIEGLPNGKEYILFYLKLLCESVDHDGNLRFSDQIPYNEEMLSTITNTNVDIVRNAVQIFSELKMMEIMDDGTYFMSQVDDMIGSETYWARKKRESKLTIDEKSFSCIKVLSNDQIALPNGTIKYVDEKRYGGNGKKVYERAGGKCEICGTDENLCIHHMNEYSNDLDDLILVCRSCHRKMETGEIVGIVPTDVQHMSNDVQDVSNASPTSPSKSKSKSKSNNNISSIPAEFDRLWEIYPVGRKQGKKKAIEAYRKARKSGTTFEEVKDGIESYVRYINANRIETRFIKQAGTFFQQNAWNDDWTTSQSGEDDLDGIL